VNSSTLRIVTACLTVSVLAAGCNSTKPLPLQKSFSQIEVGQSDSTEVLNLLPEVGMLHTTDAISVFNKQGWSSEVGIVRFSSADSTVLRKDYIQLRSQNALLLTNEKLFVFIQSVIPPDVLDEPYENDTRKHLAILNYCHESLISDALPFNEDQPTLGLVGLARTAINEAMLNLSDHPRRAYQLLEQPGFGFRHSVLGKSRLRLDQDAENIFTIRLASEDLVDIVNTW